jgi:DNA repair protein RadC
MAKVQVIRANGRFSRVAMYLRSIVRYYGRMTMGEIMSSHRTPAGDCETRRPA